MNRDSRNKLHFRWCITMIICVVITYCYMKAKATDNYKTILQIASENCNLEIVKFSVENLLDTNVQINKLTALHHASDSGCLKIVEFLVKEKTNINATGGYMGWTALHHAADKGHLEIVEFLLSKGANPTATAQDGRRPRDMAVVELRYDKNKGKPYREIIKLLAEAEDQYESTKSNH
ncbi:Ankyrin repeats (3 copies) [Wolbachia endosymbiont of Armadillidium vulgare]|nr:Ankyrin repeats (3 copies) [Wolbachia endosymbiont of Armadillidium vulgare]